MGYLYECFSALPHVFPVQISYAVFCYHVMHIGSRCHHSCTILNLWDNPRDCAVLCRRGNRDDRLASAAARGTAHEIKLAAESADEPSAHRIGHDLSCYIDFDRRVDGYDVIVLRNDERVIAIAAWLEVEDGIVVHVLVPLASAQGKSQHNLVGIDLLPGSGDDAFVDQRNRTFGERLGVDSEILAIGKIGQDRIGNTADADLHTGSVLDECDDVAGD